MRVRSTPQCGCQSSHGLKGVHVRASGPFRGLEHLRSGGKPRRGCHNLSRVRRCPCKEMAQRRMLECEQSEKGISLGGGERDAMSLVQ